MKYLVAIYVQQYLHLQKGSLLTKGHRQLYRPTEEATQKITMTQMAKHGENSVYYDMQLKRYRSVGFSP